MRKEAIFRSPLETATFRGNMGNIYYPVSNPNIIVREVNFYISPIDEIDKGDYRAKRLWRENVQADHLLYELRDSYGIVLPNFVRIVGPDRKVWLVTERIEGQDLSAKTFSEEEKPEAIKKLGDFYASLVNYERDKFTSGGLYIHDLTYGGRLPFGDNPYVSGNTQYVYGRRKGDQEDRIYLVDIDCLPDPSSDLQGHFLRVDLPGLIAMIKESEEKLDYKFVRARKRFLRFLNFLDRNVKDVYKEQVQALKEQLLQE